MGDQSQLVAHSFLLFFLATIVFLVTTYNFRLASLPASEVRGGGWEEIPRVQGQGAAGKRAAPVQEVVAVQAQEGPRGAIPH